MRPLTAMHLTAARRMPPRVPTLALGNAKAQSKWARSLRAERKAIAAYYRLIRSLPGPHYGPAAARTAHRYAVVRTGTEARVRIRNITA